jgi:hypothetical protein
MSGQAEAPRRLVKASQGAGVFLLYLAISIWFFAPPLLGHFGHRFVGFKKDPLLLLCGELTGHFWPSILGGYLFGFSQYVLAHMLAHVCLLVIFPIPLAVYFTLLRIDGRIGRTVFVVLLALVLWFEFLSSAEIFASTTIFAAFSLALACLLWRTLCRRIFAIAAEIAGAYLLAALALTPYLYFMLGHGIPAPLNPSEIFSNDLLAFVAPTRVIYGGRIFDPLTCDFSNGELETAAYLGPGLWIILVLYAASSWNTVRAKYLVLTLILLGAMSLGPVVHVGGEVLMPGPWRLLSGLPLVNQALPDRFGMYFSLAAAVMASVYLSESANFEMVENITGDCERVFARTELAIVSRTHNAPHDSEVFSRATIQTIPGSRGERVGTAA